MLELCDVECVLIPAYWGSTYYFLLLIVYSRLSCIVKGIIIIHLTSWAKGISKNITSILIYVLLYSDDSFK